MRALLSVAFLLLSVAAHAESSEKTIKIYDTAFQRAECPRGYENVGRFVEAKDFKKGLRRSGVECRAGKNSPSSRSQKAPLSKPRELQQQGEDGPDSLEVLNEEGKKATCPDGYSQTGTFSNFQFSNGKAETRSGVYCIRKQKNQELPADRL